MIFVKILLKFFSPDYQKHNKIMVMTRLKTVIFLFTNFAWMALNVYLQLTTLMGEAKLLDVFIVEYSFFCIVAMKGFFPYEQQFKHRLSKERELKDLRRPMGIRSDLLA